MQRSGDESEPLVAWWWPWRWFGLACLAALPYLNAIRGGIVYDDRVVLNNPDVLGTRPLSELWSKDFWGHDMWTGGWTHMSYRPITVLSLRMDTWLGFGLPGYHVTNIIVHIIVAWLALMLCLELFPRHSRFSALCAACVFTAHPLHTEVGRSARVSWRRWPPFA